MTRLVRAKPTQMFHFHTSIYWCMSVIKLRDINNGSRHGARPMFLAQHDDYNSEESKYQWVDTISWTVSPLLKAWKVVSRPICWHSNRKKERGRLPAETISSYTSFVGRNTLLTIVPIQFCCKLLRLKRILVGTSSGLPYTHFFGVSTGVCFQNWWVDAQKIGTPR
jgi:hypothetical protein